MTAITALSRQGGRRYLQTGLGVGLVSMLLCVGGLAPTPPVPPVPPVPPIVPVTPVVPVVVPGTAVGGSGGGGWGRSWAFEGTPFERRAHATLRAPAGRLWAHGAVVRAVTEVAAAPVGARRIARLSATAGLAHVDAAGYIFNLARHNRTARAVLDEDEDDETRLTE